MQSKATKGLSVLTAVALQLGAGTVWAQGFSPGSMDPTRARPAAPTQQGSPEDVPETHAAPGGADSTLPEGREPTLPDDPLEISEAAAAHIGSDRDDAVDYYPGKAVDRDFYGLYYRETVGNYRLQTLFPLWFQRTQPSAGAPDQVDRASLFGGIYYNRRSATRADDILFPLFWNLRDTESRTTVVGPFVNRVAPNETDNWLAPLYFTGTRKDGSYQIIPPLLTYLNHDAEGGFNLIGPAFCSWNGDSKCFGSPTSRHWGLAPLMFFGHDRDNSYRFVLPALHYHHDNRALETSLDIWGPFFRQTTETRELFHILPLYWSIWGEHERHTTLFPFFHYGWRRNAELLITPLWLNATSEEGHKTFATWGYARHRGKTELDMYTPLLWLYRDPAIDLNQTLLFPFYYRRTSPREDSLAVFPFYAHFRRHGLSESTWITPLFQHTHDLTGWSTNLYPIFYFGRDRHSSHSVVAPIFWDFSNPRERATIAFPVYWRFAKPNSLTQLIGNVLYEEKRVKHGLDWKLHILPAFSYGETPDGHSWNILFGLVGFKRKADLAQMKLFWIPITLSGEP